MKNIFEVPKKAYATSPELSHPNFDDPFVVEIDASVYSVGDIQAPSDKDGKLHTVLDESSTTDVANQKYLLWGEKVLAAILH